MLTFSVGTYNTSFAKLWYFRSRRYVSKVKFALEQTMKPKRGSRDIAIFFLNLGARWGRVIKATLRPLYSREETRHPLYRRLYGPQGWCGRVVENLAPTGIRYPYRPARSESLYRQSYPGPPETMCKITK